MTRVGQTFLAIIFVVVIVSIGVGYINSQEDDEVTVEFAGFWLPPENHAIFEVHIGERVERLTPAATAEGRETLGFAHFESVPRGTIVQLVMTSNPEEPIVITECYIAFLEEESQGQIGREGAECHASTIVPPG